MEQQRMHVETLAGEGVRDARSRIRAFGPLGGLNGGRPDGRSDAGADERTGGRMKRRTGARGGGRSGGPTVKRTDQDRIINNSAAMAE